MGRLDGKVAVITGGASGIGEGTARLFAQEGARVVIGDVQGEKAEAVAASIGESCVPVVADVTNSEDVQGLVRTAVERFGQLDVMFNNAGIGRIEGPIHECPEETFDRVIATNLKGVWLGIKYAVPEMLRNGGGSIICTASVAGMTGFGSQATYAMSKAGVISMVKSATAEVADQGIRVNCICPGGILTGLSAPTERSKTIVRERFEKIHPVGRAGEPEDIAQAALWLASDESRFVTGQAIVVDGGWTTVDTRWNELLAQARR